MSRYRTLVLICLLATSLTALATSSGAHVSAQRPSRAALVVQMASAAGEAEASASTRVTRCIAFSESSISGLELLARSGLDVITWGGAVCQIGRTGCQYPSEPCFCQCMRPPCSYWSYWYWKQDSWMYSPIGSADHTVVDGSIEAWMWGNADTPPDAITFAEVCPPDSTAISAPPAANGTVAAPPLGQYVAFVGMALAMLAGFWLIRRRARVGA